MGSESVSNDVKGPHISLAQEWVEGQGLQGKGTFSEKGWLRVQKRGGLTERLSPGTGGRMGTRSRGEATPRVTTAATAFLPLCRS